MMMLFTEDDRRILRNIQLQLAEVAAKLQEVSSASPKSKHMLADVPDIFKFLQPPITIEEKVDAIAAYLHVRFQRRPAEPAKTEAVNKWEDFALHGEIAAAANAKKGRKK